MKRKVFRMLLLWICTALVLYGCLPAGQDEDASEGALAELDRAVVMLPEGSPLLFPDGSFAKLDPLFRRARIIGLGEATHGTREFFELKHRLLRYLVEHHRVRALGFEYDFRFRSSLDIDRYVTEGIGDPDTLLADTYWTHRNKEFRDLLMWMRRYNADRGAGEKVRFIGIDSQLDIRHTDELADDILQSDPGLHTRLRDMLDQIRSLGRIEHKNMTRKKYEEIKSLFLRLKQDAAAYYADHPGTAEAEERELLLHLIDSYTLSHEFLFMLHEKRNVRERHMAEHCLWLNEFAGGKGRVAIWAHNAHVAKNPSFPPQGDPSMGEYIREELGEGYLSIATSLSAGSFAAVTEDCFGDDTKPIIWELKEDPPPESANRLFHEAGPPNFFLNLSAPSPGGRLHAFLGRPRSFLGVGDYYTRDTEDHYKEDRIINLARCFDILFHFRKTHAIDIIKAEADL
jgi:erythromycin esterase